MLIDVRDGSMDGVNLSGVRLGLNGNFPDVVSNGNWKLGLTIDEGASDEQVKALTEILSGQQGGPFGEMAPLVAEFAGVERAAVAYSDTGGSIGGMSFSYEPLRGQDGNPTTMKNAVFGFAPEFEIGTTKGHLEVFGHHADASYGEAADFEWSSETHEQIRA